MATIRCINTATMDRKDEDDDVYRVDLSSIVAKEIGATGQDEEEILPSFAAIKQKTLDTLYFVEGKDHNVDKNSKNNHFQVADKSPKGSVDSRIRPLVDLINHHESLATLSSCSGRMALFDPNSAPPPT